MSTNINFNTAILYAISLSNGDTILVDESTGIMLANHFSDIDPIRYFSDVDGDMIRIRNEDIIYIRMSTPTSRQSYIDRYKTDADDKPEWL